MAPSVLIFSKQIWNKLSSEDQAIIKAAALESVPYLQNRWAEREAVARRMLGTTGAQIVSDVDKNSFAQAMAPAFAKLVASPKMRDWLTSIERMETR